MRSVLEDRPDDPVRQELAAFIAAMSFDEQVDLVTLMWIGRGDGTIADWAELRDTACGRHNRWTPRYLLGDPLLGDFLAEGLAQFGYSCEEFANEQWKTTTTKGRQAVAHRAQRKAGMLGRAEKQTRILLALNSGDACLLAHGLSSAPACASIGETSARKGMARHDHRSPGRQDP